VVVLLPFDLPSFACHLRAIDRGIQIVKLHVAITAVGLSPQSASVRTARSREVVMTIVDASQFLPHMGLDPLRVVGCAAPKCQNSFTLTNGFAASRSSRR
jgi:selenocysteine lyase/cysteine desulfurase